MYIHVWLCVCVCVPERHWRTVIGLVYDEKATWYDSNRGELIQNTEIGKTEWLI